MTLLTRRQFATHTARAAAALGVSATFADLFASDKSSRPFLIGACDWSIGKAGDVTGMELAKELGLDGLQVSPGTEADDIKLRRADVQQPYREARERFGIEIASLGFGELNKVPFKSDPRTVGWVSDVIDVCHALGRQVILIAFFSKGDLKGDTSGQEEVVRRFKELAPKAERLGVTLGIESWLSAEEHMSIIERVGSPAVKVYYDVANSEKMGYDIYREIRWLGKQGQICEFHMKENGSLLGQGRVDFKKVRAAIDDIGYNGWMQIEGAIPPGGKMPESYTANRAFLRETFK